MTIDSFPAYLATLERAIERLPPSARLAFGAWCARRLFAAHADDLPDAAARTAAAEALTFVERRTAADTDEAASIDAVLLRLQTIDVDQIDAVTSSGTGALKLLECLEDALVLSENGDTAFAVACAQCRIDVIDVVMTDDLGLDTRDPSTHIHHPLLSAEIDAQIAELERLQRGNRSPRPAGTIT